MGAKDLIKKLAKDKAKDNFEVFEDSRLTNISGWIPTGSYSFNKIISGSYLKGIPHGRVTGLAGESGVGKSFMCGQIMREAQKLDYLVIVFDSESSIDKGFLGRIGVDTEAILFKSITTVNEFKTSTVNILKDIYAEDPKQKVLIVMDSIGNLTTEKELNDAEEGKTAQDMGLRAKQLKACSRVITNQIARCNAAMIVTNHTYEQPAANPMAMPTQVFSGGTGFIYICSTIIFLKKYAQREEQKQISDGKNKKVITTNRIVATTGKNRFVREGLSGEMLLSFKSGLHKWYGLLEDALRHGFFEKQSTRIYVKHLDKKYFATQIYADNQVWEPILEDLSAAVEKETAFSSLTNEGEMLDDLNSIEESSDDSENEEDN